MTGQFADLPLLAEHYEQNAPGRRPALETHLRDALSTYRTPAESHHLIAKLPIDEIWTTNYDQLLEITAPDATQAHPARTPRRPPVRSAGVAQPGRPWSGHRGDDRDDRD